MTAQLAVRIGETRLTKERELAGHSHSNPLVLKRCRLLLWDTSQVELRIHSC
uniref:Uncharacterized protein n=1 Tax=Anguilla anguilla TaxID=7936 RepID=A0A0E9XHC2_ANGAN